MSELAKTDPIFGGQEVHLSEEGKRLRLEDIDPIFKIEDKSQNPKIKPASEQNFMDWLMQKVDQIPLDKAEVVGGGAAGYFVNPKLQKAADAVSQMSPMTSGEKWSANWANQNRPGVGGIPEASGAYQRSKGQGPVTSKMSQKWGPRPPQVPGQEVTPLLDRLLAQSKGSGIMDAVGSGLKKAGTFASKVPGAGGALGGAGAVMGYQGMEDRYSKGDIPGAILSGLGGAGGLLSLVPHPMTRGAGLALESASPMALMLLDRIRANMNENVEPTEREMRDAQVPAMAFRRKPV